ncbi:aminoacyl-histidine dipeptidase [Marinilabilia salmonicolor]|jgi:dipeptidase D|uniref:Cytosol non-specific dipeptidase n=1 Tax=Marinilabilia salmonicolor TaxID=989 RepID=A0A2T0WTJ5_9BACT|nr:aminoacyl-histidine dipeptidase [Marinilabilia salmonicolor]PRY90009.1 dipeptidase D [Marinilabilia salmonicolor]RCW28830.1 dipeptidase D [Marinilabilia salmonicolor]
MINKVFEDLYPEKVWEYFDEICRIPRPSKHEDKIVEWLLDFARKHDLESKRDEIGNVLICKPATSGMENKKTVILQSHVDMVGEKNNDKKHDFFKDPIVPVRDGEWIKADGTTLGADDGIGMAAQLALLTSENIPHPALECLFTVDEETGLTGAFNLEEGFFEGRTLINLDSEDEGELFIGCAGGIDTLARFKPEYVDTPAAHTAIEISVTGLKGGHSGDDIHKGLGNANKILVRYLWLMARDYDFKVSRIEGGNLRNAIAREASALGVVPSKYKEEARVMLNLLTHEVEQELRLTDPGVKLRLGSTDLPEKVFSAGFQQKLLYSLYACPHGVMEWSREIEGLVETSTNLASVKMLENEILVTTSQRSSVESARDNIANMVESVFSLAGAKVEHSDGYPGWEPDMNSPVLNVAVAAYHQLFGQKPEVKAIHAGLECGLFLQKYPDMDMISIGPTIKGAHSPDERLHIETVRKFWDHLLLMLKS